MLVLSPHSCRCRRGTYVRDFASSPCVCVVSLSQCKDVSIFAIFLWDFLHYCGIAFPWPIMSAFVGPSLYWGLCKRDIFFLRGGKLLVPRCDMQHRYGPFGIHLSLAARLPPSSHSSLFANIALSCGDGAIKLSRSNNHLAWLFDIAGQYLQMLPQVAMSRICDGRNRWREKITATYCKKKKKKKNGVNERRAIYVTWHLMHVVHYWKSKSPALWLNKRMSLYFQPLDFGQSVTI